MVRRCPNDLEILTPPDDLRDAIADPARYPGSPAVHTALDHDRFHHHRVIAAASAAAMAVGLMSAGIAVLDLRSGASPNGAIPATFDLPQPVRLSSPTLCQPAADRLQALDRLLEAAVDAARDIQDDLAAHDSVSASVALRYLRIYIDDAQSTEGCGIDLRPGDLQSRDV